MDFCKEFNSKTQSMGDDVIPVILTAYEDRTFTFITKTPVTSHLIKKAIKVAKGSATPNKDKVGTLSTSDLDKIASIKLKDLNTSSIDQAKKIVAGTARSMGVIIEK